MLQARQGECRPRSTHKLLSPESDHLAVRLCVPSNKQCNQQASVSHAVAGAPAQRYGAERLLEMATGGRAVQQAALASPEALRALLERALSGLLQVHHACVSRHTVTCKLGGIQPW